MTAACWFNYLLVFLIQVTNHSPSHAGLVMLAGQVGDAIATPLVGLFSDRTTSRFGRRKVWLAGGAIVVNICFFFVFSKCYLCDVLHGESYKVMKTLYYAILGAAFNFGWASVQVSHMALVPELTSNESERVRLNSARYAGTITATLMVLGIAWFSFKKYGLCHEAFEIMAISSIAIGDFFTLIFLFGVKEKTYSSLKSEPKNIQIPQVMEDGDMYGSQTFFGSFNVKQDWKSWFKMPMFYQVGIIYMCSRIIVNISQIFMPFYLQFYLRLEHSHTSIIAEVPILVMATSFTWTFFLKRLNKKIGRRSAYIFGGFFVFGGLIGLYLLDYHMWSPIFAVAVLLGIGTTTVLVTSISMESDLIGMRSDGAFVFGSLSFLDKISNGILVEFTSKYSRNPDKIKNIITFIPGGATIAAIVVSFTILAYWHKKDPYESFETQPFLPKTTEINNTVEEDNSKNYNTI